MQNTERLAVKLLGPLRVSNATGVDYAVAGRKPQAVLAYLAFHAGQRVPRETLATLLWGDRFDSQARQSLRECLSRLRRTLGDDAAEILLADRDNVTLDTAHLDVDTRTFEELAANGVSDSLGQAADLYSGDLLHGFATREPGFDDWLDGERRRLNDLACSVLVRLSAQQESEQSDDAALDTALRLTALDPACEEAHRTIMRIHARHNRQGDAMRQYRACTDALRGVLDVEPEAETQRLAEEIRAANSTNAVAGANASVKTETIVQGRKLKIAVLPFSGLTGESEQDYFVNGINEDIVTALTRNRWLSVMGHNTTMVLQGRYEDMLIAARDFGVDYVVNGSVRKASNRVRITAQLIEANSGEHIWAERYDRDLKDIFGLQDEITYTITATIEPELAANEGRRARQKATENLDAWDCYHLGLMHMYKFTKGDNATAQALFKRALDIDPEFALAYARLSYAKVMSVVYFETDAADGLLDEALSLAEQATKLDDLDAVAQFSLGRVHLIRGEFDHSIAAFETALDLNPCLAHIHCGLGDTLAYRGDPSDSIGHFEEAVRLSPHDPYRWAFLMYGAMAYLFLHRHEEAAQWANAASRVPNSHYWATAVLVAALGHLGRADEARAARAKLLADNPDFTCSFARQWLFYIRDPDQIGHYVEGLKLAGIPD